MDLVAAEPHGKGARPPGDAQFCQPSQKPMSWPQSVRQRPALTSIGIEAVLSNRALHYVLLLEELFKYFH